MEGRKKERKKKKKACFNFYDCNPLLFYLISVLIVSEIVLLMLSLFLSLSFSSTFFPSAFALSAGAQRFSVIDSFVAKDVLGLLLADPDSVRRSDEEGNKRDS